MYKDLQKRTQFERFSSLSIKGFELDRNYSSALSLDPLSVKGFQLDRNSSSAVSLDLVHEYAYNMDTEDSKYPAIIEEESIMEYVNKSRDFSKISEEDLDEAFGLLRQRRPQSWSKRLEDCGKAFHKKIMKLRRKKDVWKYIDPEKKTAAANKLKVEYDARDLIISPEHWDMRNRKAGIDLRDVLHHLTIYVPFKGRPFIRAWLETLVPCFSHWILVSNSKNDTVKETLKNILGAFGQPGIVVCLADKGVTLLNSLKDAARSVEALGRGTVERYYWKRLTEANCGGEKEWRDLASIPSWSYELSQLNVLPAGWLLDSTDWVHIFANIVSPEISKRLKEVILKTVQKKNLNANVSPGPAKTIARSIAKSHEYYSEYCVKKEVDRWSRFGSTFEGAFGRSPENPEDFVWNVMDFARCSIIVRSARELLMAKELIEKNFSVVCVKNGYNSNCEVKGSGYRDLKLLIEVEFDNLKLEGVPKIQKNTKFICEVQLMLETWLQNKITTSRSYKVLRATTLKNFLGDFAKYLGLRNKEGNWIQELEAAEVIKNGWANLAKTTDFSDIDSDELLLKAARFGWEPSGIEILVEELGANLGAVHKKKGTALQMAANRGHHKIIQTLISLKSDVDARNKWGYTALHRAAYSNEESCVRELIDANCSLELKNNDGKTALDIALQYHSGNERLVKLLRGENLSPFRAWRAKNVSKINNIMIAANEGCLTDYFDNHNVPHSMLSKLLATKVAFSSFANFSQVLWFGGDINYKDENGVTALYNATKYGNLASVVTLLEKGANVNVKNKIGWMPLHRAIKYGTNEMVEVLIAARADLEAKVSGGCTPLHIAIEVKENRKIAALLSNGASIYAKLDSGLGPLDIVTDDDLRDLLQVATNLDRKD